ncbi:MAG: site-specific integrase [Candidatus Thermoplasmatota archaeon]
MPSLQIRKVKACKRKQRKVTGSSSGLSDTPWSGAVMAFAIPAYYYTGLRPSELRKAHLEDLDLKTWTLRVRHPKGEASWGSRRTVPIPPPLRTYVLDYLDARRKRLEEIGMQECEALIPNLSPWNTTGEPYTAQSILRMKRMVEERSGIRFEMRKLRNTCGQHLKDRGVPIEAISKLLGHASTVTTEKHYARMRDAHAFRLVESAWEQKPIASIEPDILKPRIEV